MRVAVMALVALSLSPGCRQAERLACGDTLPPGMRQDWHGRTYIKPERISPDVLMQNPPAPATVPDAAPETTANSSPLPTTSQTAPDSLAGLDTFERQLTGRPAMNRISAMSGRGKLSSLQVENGKSTLTFKYDDGSTGIIKTGGASTNFQFTPGSALP